MGKYRIMTFDGGGVRGSLIRARGLLRLVYYQDSSHNRG
jgi:patatin-like phospholipase/acyl hydrolase